MTYLTILTASHQRLVAHPNLLELCEIAPKARNRLALICISSFLFALMALIGYRALPLLLVPLLIGVLLVIFILSAMLASRCGRLCDISPNIEYMSNAEHLANICTECADYRASVYAQGRPFTRLDLDEMGKIYLRQKKRTKR